MKRLIIALICLVTLSATIACEGYHDYVKKMKFEYGYTVKKHNVNEADIKAISQALDKHEWQKSRSLTKDEAKTEWESFLSHISTKRKSTANQLSSFFLWRWAESNRRPNKVPNSFLHVYSSFGCRPRAAGRRAIHGLSSQILAELRGVCPEHPVLMIPLYPD